MNHEHVAINIQAMLDCAEPPVSKECCIYKVPFNIRKLNEDAYTPKFVSIGPYHHHTHPRLQNMERHKRIFCSSFLKRANATLDTLVCYIQEVEPNIHHCYSDIIQLSKEELVKMILVDSAFIIELFWRYYHDEWSGDDLLPLKPWLHTSIRLDLLLLENQLPFFVLDRLFNLSIHSESGSHSKSGNGEIPSFFELTFHYFKDYLIFDFDDIIINHLNNITISHFTDLLRASYLQHPPEKRPLRSGNPLDYLPSASELVEAGVKFRVNTESDCCLLDFRFSRRVLKIPQLTVEDSTEILFRNIVALELCHYPWEAYIMDYILFWDFLLNTSKDVDVLVRKKILVNWLGDTNSVANLFNGLCKNITHSHFNSNYRCLCENLNDYCRNPRHKSKATLRRDYCNTPWQMAASIAGIVLLLLTLLQSMCSVVQVIQGSKN